MEQSDQSACCKYILGSLLNHPVGFASKHAFSAPPFFDLRVSTKEAFDLNALTMAFCINTALIPIDFRSFMRILLSSSSAPIKSASSSPFVSSPHLLSNFEVTVQKSLLRHFLDWWPPHPPMVDKLLKNYYIFHKKVVIKSESNNFSISSPRIGKKVHMQYININIFTWFWQTMSDVQKKFFKVSQSGNFRRCEKIWFF